MTSSPVPRSHSRTSIYSTTTYHSFQDIELYDHGSQSETSGTSSAPRNSSRRSKIPELKVAPVRRPRPSQRDDAEYHPSSFKMLRQDSGYESSTPQPTPIKETRPATNYPRRRHTSITSPVRDTSRPAPKRPALRRSATSKPGGPISHTPGGRSSLNLNRPTPQQLQRKHSYFQFPSPEHLDDATNNATTVTPRQSIDLAPVIRKVNTANHEQSLPSSSHSSHHQEPAAPLSPIPPPPQTTHYWTSDRTRRLEYAAIDAASRGVRGWVLRHMVPECFVPQNQRRIGFEDDDGSVRRYRLDLEIECPEDSVPPSPVGEKKRGFRARRVSWWARLRGCTN